MFNSFSLGEMGSSISTTFSAKVRTVWAVSHKTRPKWCRLRSSFFVWSGQGSIETHVMLPMKAHQWEFGSVWIKMWWQLRHCLFMFPGFCQSNLVATPAENRRTRLALFVRVKMLKREVVSRWHTRSLACPVIYTSTARWFASCSVSSLLRSSHVTHL